MTITPIRFLSIVWKMPHTNYVIETTPESDMFLDLLLKEATIAKINYFTLDFAEFDTAAAAFQSLKGKKITSEIISGSNRFICHFKNADFLSESCSYSYWLRTILETERYTVGNMVVIFSMMDESIGPVFLDKKAPFYNSHFQLN